MIGITQEAGMTQGGWAWRGLDDTRLAGDGLTGVAYSVGMKMDVVLGSI